MVKIMELIFIQILFRAIGRRLKRGGGVVFNVGLKKKGGVVGVRHPRPIGKR